MQLSKITALVGCAFQPIFFSSAPNESPGVSFMTAKAETPLAPSSLSTSRSDRLVRHSGHQLMSRVARYISPCSCRRTNASVTARLRSASMVNFDRAQSGLAPRMRCCSRMRSPVSRRHCQMRATKASLPRSWRVLPSLASMRSTTSCVAMPAWSVPGCQRALYPRMRCHLTSVSSSVHRWACPMCSEPVTLGGGMGTTYTGRVSAGSSLAAKTPWVSQYAYQRGSTSAGS